MNQEQRTCQRWVGTLATGDQPRATDSGAENRKGHRRQGSKFDHYKYIYIYIPICIDYIHTCILYHHGPCNQMQPKRINEVKQHGEKARSSKCCTNDSMIKGCNIENQGCNCNKLLQWFLAVWHFLVHFTMSWITDRTAPSPHQGHRRILRLHVELVNFLP